MVERPNGWIKHCRRITRHYDVTLDAHEGFLLLSQIALYSDDSTAASCSTPSRRPLAVSACVAFVR